MKTRLRLLVAAICLAMLPSVGHAQAENQEILPEWEDAGVLGPGEYESPNWGYEVTWSGDWLIDETEDEPVESDISDGDSLYLAHDSEFAWMAILGASTEGLEWADEQTLLEYFVDYLGSPENLAEFEEAGDISVVFTEVDSDLGTVVYLLSGPGSADFLMYYSARVLTRADAIVLTLMMAQVDEFEPIYSDANEFVEINRDPAVDGLSNRELGTIEEDATAILESPNDDAATSSDYLEAVVEHVAELEASRARVEELFSGEEPSAEGSEELQEAIELWEEAESRAEDLEPDSGLSELHEVYLEYTEAYGDASDAWYEGLEHDADTPGDEQAMDDFFASMEEADELGEELVDLLEDEGIELPDAEDDIDSSFL